MASNVVASVAVLIRPITKGFKKNIKDAYKEAVAEIQPDAPEVPTEEYEEQGKKAGGKFAQAFGKWAKRSLAVAGVAIGAAVGASFVSGFRSAVNQQQGQLVLSGLYGDADKARKTLEGIRGVASGSPIDYAAYQSAAESLAYAGAEGEDAIGVLENVGKAITASGGDSSNMDRATDAILSGVNAGKFQLDTLQQLSDAGVPILSGLADHFGVSMEEVNKMASAGKIELDDVMAVMQNGTGEIFQQMIGAGEEASKSFGNQWKIAKDNVSVAIGRVMLPLIEMLAPAIKPASDAIIDFIEQVPAMLDGVRSVIQWVKDNIAWIGTLAAGFTALGVAALVTAAPGIWATFTAAVAASPVLTALAGAARAAWTAITGPVGLAILAVTAITAALVWFFTKTEIGQKIWERVWGAIKTATAATWEWIKTTLWPGMITVWNAIASGAIWLYQNAILPAWNGIRTAISAVVGWLVNTAWPFIQTVWHAIAGAAIWLWQNVMMPVWTGIKTAIAIAVTAILVYVDWLKWNWQSVIAPVAMWLWNNVMKPVWNGIKNAIGAVVAWFRDTAWPILQSVINWVANAAIWLYQNAILPAWNGIKRAISAVVAWFRDTAWPIAKSIIDFFALGFRNLYTFVILPVWNKIRSAISAVVTWLRDVAWAKVVSPTLSALKRGFNVMRDSLKNAWNFVKDNVIAPVANWFRDHVGPLFDRATDGIKNAFDTMKNAIKRAWQAIRDTAKVPVEFVVDKIINKAIIGNYNDVASTFGLDEIGEVSLPSGWTRGGILPGQSSWRDGDDQVIAARRGEGVLVSEGLRDRQSQSLFLQANKAARTMGTSFADFVSGGFAGGGLVQLRKPFTGSYPRGDGFGARGGSHKGIDWPMPSGTVLKAVAAGVANRTWNAAAGRKLELSIGNGLVAGYHHLSGYIAKDGQSYGRGSDIGYVGSTGRSSGPHLHFSLRKDGKYVDPAPYLGAGGEAGSDGGFWNPFTSLWDSLKNRVREGVGDSAWGDMLFEMPRKIIGGAKDWVADKITAIGDWASGAVQGAAGRARWSPVMSRALSMKGQFGPRRLGWGLDRLMQESGGDPRAINNWDSNAKRGTPSKGLMQVIGPTFQAYKEPGHGDIWKPLDNILASINYTLARYGSLKSGWTRAGGYAEGGIVGGPTLFDSGGVLPPGLTTVLNASRKPEAVLTNDQLKQLRIIASGRGEKDGGDTFIGYGYTAEDVARQWRKEQKKVEALHGR